jgi:hypothetical protein
MANKYQRRTETRVLTVGTQAAVTLAVNSLLANVYHVGVWKNTFHLSVVSDTADAGLVISYRLLNKLGGQTEVIKAATTLRTGAYAANTLERFEISAMSGANEIEITITSVGGISGYLEGLWLDAGGTVLSTKLTTTVLSKPAGAPGVAAGGSETINLYAPLGWLGVGQGIQVDILPPTGGSAGSHGVTVYVGSLHVLYAGGAFGTPLHIGWGGIITATTQTPPDAASQVFAWRGLIWDSVGPVTIKYENATDVLQDLARVYIVQSGDRRAA